MGTREVNAPFSCCIHPIYRRDQGSIPKPARAKDDLLISDPTTSLRPGQRPWQQEVPPCIVALCATAITGRTRMITARFFTEYPNTFSPSVLYHPVHIKGTRASVEQPVEQQCMSPSNQEYFCASTSRQPAPVTSANPVRETGKLMSKQHCATPSHSTLSRPSPQPAVITAILWRKDFLPFSLTERPERHET
jgi:hypothetical protein